MAQNRYWEINHVSGYELMAMRMMRGKTIQQMSKIVNKSDIRLDNYSVRMLNIIEKDIDIAPPDVVEIYMVELGITNSHMKQFKKILKGKLKTFTEDRQIPKSIKDKVRKKCNDKCVRCGSKEKLHFHHVERFSEGGQNDVENLILLCVSCHAEEHKGERAYSMLKKQAEG